MQPIKLTLLEGGYCHHLEAVAIRGGRWKVCEFAAMFGLIEHPQYGYMLYDTGYTDRFHRETNKFPFKLYAMTTPVFIEDPLTAKSQLAARHITPEEIQYIIISHFHADHIAGLRDFPNAKFICFRSAYEAVKNKRGFQACLNGFIPNLLPDNFLERVVFADDKPIVKLADEFMPFNFGYDLFQDSSLIAVDLPGHASGQLGILLSLQDGINAFLVADSCWFSESYRHNRLPHPITRLVHRNFKHYRSTLNNLHELHCRNSDLRIIPSHCNEIRNKIRNGLECWM